MKNMEIRKKFLFLFFLIYKISFSLVIGKKVNETETDCVKLSPFIQGHTKGDSLSCCENDEIECDNDGFITSLKM